jgi:hypothetical protein
MNFHPISVDSGYSPPLHIELHLDGRQYAVAEVCGDFVRLRNAVVAPPGVGTLRVEIDGRPTLFRIDLFDGIDPQRKRQPCRTQAPLDADAAPAVTALAG